MVPLRRGCLSHFLSQRQLRNKKTYSEYTIRAPEWRGESHDELCSAREVEGGLSCLPTLPEVDSSTVRQRCGTPVVAPYPVELERLASEAHDAHEQAVHLDECEHMEDGIDQDATLDDDASVASWPSLEATPEPQPPKQQSRKNKRRARKREEHKEANRAHDASSDPRGPQGTTSCASEKDVARKRAAEAEAIHLDFDLAGPDVPYSPACFTGKPRKQGAGDKQRLELADVMPGMKLFAWDGR